MKKELVAGALILTMGCTSSVPTGTAWDCAFDDQVMDSTGQCRNIDTYVDAYRDTIVIPDCEEDENWDAVDFQDPRGEEDIHGVTRACVHIDE